MGAIWGPVGPAGQKNSLFTAATPTQSCPLRGDPLHEHVLACAACALPGNGADGGTSHMGAHTAEGHKRALQELCSRGRGRCYIWTKEYVEHLFRDSLRESQLAALEKRRPRTFGGMGARLHRMLMLRDIATCDIELDKCYRGPYGQPAGPIGEVCALTIAAPIALKGSAKMKGMCSRGVQHGKRSQTPSYRT